MAYLDSHIVFIEVEQECGDEISIGAIFDFRPARSTLTAQMLGRIGGSKLDIGVAA